MKTRARKGVGSGRSGNPAGRTSTANNGKKARASGKGRGGASRYARVGTKQPVVN